MKIWKKKWKFWYSCFNCISSAGIIVDWSMRRNIPDEVKGL
ncbi:hypothetical protein [Megasphaera sp. DJF_B143]|nr:hypothetical protein [Megasphaera sp. DJF_B143]